MTKLIIIRGPSGSGKSTVANKLLEIATRPTIIVSEDKINKTFSDINRPDHEESKDLAVQTVLFGLSISYDVIYEGILRFAAYEDRFKKIIEKHPDENYFIYLDVDFEEAVSRHKTRPEKYQFTTEKMEEWRAYASATGLTDEVIITQDSTLDDTVASIMKVAKCIQ